jgi:hypothetical protein
MPAGFLENRLPLCRSVLELTEAFATASLDLESDCTPEQIRQSEEIFGFALSIITRYSDPGSTALDDAQLHGLKQLALEHLVHGSALVADAMLNAFDAGFRRNLYLAFSGQRGAVQLQPGSPFPMCDAHPKELFHASHACSPRSSNLGDPHSRRDVLGVYRGQHGWRVVFDYGCPTLLDNLVDVGKVAVALPNSSDAELELGMIDRIGLRFFDVKPKDVVRQGQRIDALIDQAEKAGATALLLPELSTTPELARAGGARLRRTENLSLLAAGSYHFRESLAQIRRNRLELHSQHRAGALCHDKFNAFELRKWRDTKYQHPLVEDIAVRRTITVHWAHRWSLVTLICKDFLNPDAKQLLLHLRPRFVFVVALSDDIASFVAPAQDLAESCQTTVIIANFGLHPANEAAIASLPVRDGHLPMTRSVTLEEIRGGLALLDLKSLNLQWK